MTRSVRKILPKESSDPKREISLSVNGEAVTRKVSTRLLLADFLRHELGLTGTHVGCEHGVCGCCTVTIDGATARSCLTLAVQAADVLHPVQQAFHECHALQCGFCTPGFIMSVVSYFEENENPDLGEDAIRDALSGNLCRCTGYQNIVKAVRRAHELMNSER